MSKSIKKTTKKLFNHTSKNLKYRSITPILDSKVLSYFDTISKKINLNKILKDQKIQNEFLDKYFKWILMSSNFKYLKLKKFKFKCFAQGTTQVFDYFYLKHKGKRFRAFQGEYAYHFISWRYAKFRWKYIEDDVLRKGDALVLSVPFSGNGGDLKNIDKILKKCTRLKIPVLIDCCYSPLATNMSFNFDHECIEYVSFSLSKVFPVGHLRIGMRLSRTDDDDQLFVYKSFNYKNRLSMKIGLDLIKKFDHDYISSKYYQNQKSICNKLNLAETKVVNLVIGDNNWNQYKRAKWNRMCISSIII